MKMRSSSISLLLLQHLLEMSRGGRVFTAAEAVEQGTRMGLTAGHTYKLLSELTQRGVLDRPRGRLYAMRPPFGGLAPVRPLAIAVHAVHPAAVSAETALVFWGMLEQAPLHEEVVSTSARIQWTHGIRAEGRDHLWSVGGALIRFCHIPRSAFFGVTTVRLDADTIVPMFDRERTFLDLLLRPAAGRADWAAEIVREHHQSLQIDQLRRYAHRAGIAQRLDEVLAPHAVVQKIEAS